MNKVFVTVAIIFALVAGLNIAGHVYRYEFYDWALAYESEKALLKKKYIELANQRVAYLEGPRENDQETVLLLHGFGASKENWLRYAAFLTPSFHVIALDLAGHGENAPDLKGSYTVAAQVAFVNSFRQKINVEKMHLVGNSMGGAISALYAATHPGNTISTVLISPAGVHDVPSEMDELLESGSNPLLVETAEEFPGVVDFVMEQQPYIPGPILSVQSELSASRSAVNKLIFSQLRGDLVRGMEADLKRITAPTLIIWGAQDRAIHVDNINRYAKLVHGAQKLVIEDVGHLAMVEVPEISAKASLEFWSGIK